jgi:hypothetical protein
LSPSTLASNSSFIGIGLVMSNDQVRLLPFTFPVMSCEPISLAVVPVKVSPLVLIVASTVRAPIGVLMVIFQLPSADIKVPPESGAPPNRVWPGRARVTPASTS